MYASQALPLAGVPIPDDFITADDVSAGKPDPEPYLKGAAALGLDPSDCTSIFIGDPIGILIQYPAIHLGLVFEDAPAGLRSGKAAGSKVLAVLTTHSLESVKKTDPDFILKDFSECAFPLFNWAHVGLTRA